MPLKVAVDYSKEHYPVSDQECDGKIGKHVPARLEVSPRKDYWLWKALAQVERGKDFAPNQKADHNLY